MQEKIVNTKIVTKAETTDTTKLETNTTKVETDMTNIEIIDRYDVLKSNFFGLQASYPQHKITEVYIKEK